MASPPTVYGEWNLSLALWVNGVTENFVLRFCHFFRLHRVLGSTLYFAVKTTVTRASVPRNLVLRSVV